MKKTESEGGDLTEPDAETGTGSGSGARPKSRLETFRFPLAVLAAVAVGALLGSWSPALGRSLAPFGGLYLSLLRMCIIPLLLTAIVSSLGRTVARHQLGRRLLLVSVVFAAGLAMAAATGIFVGSVTGIGADLRTSRALGSLLLAAESTAPGKGAAEPTAGGNGRDEAFAELFEGSAAEPGPRFETPETAAGGSRFLDYLARMIPQNLVAALHEENFLGILFFSALMGIALGFAPAEGRGSALRVLESFFDALLRIIGWVILLLPAGLVCLVAGQVAGGSLEFVPVLGRLALVACMTAAVALGLYFSVIWWVLRRPPRELLRGLREPLIVALATSSSLASIPPAMIALRREFGLSAENVKLLLPLGVMMNPVGSALFFSIGAIFAVQLHAEAATVLGFKTLLLLVIGSMLAALAAMGLPGTSSVFMLGVALDPLGVPAEVGIIALMVVLPLIDPLFTLVNVLGNCAATVFLDRRLGESS